MKTIFILTAAGLGFSGYLSAVKLLSGSCAFNESCPYFLGYPACWYGFAMYLVMCVMTGLAIFKKVRPLAALTTDVLVSTLGIIFAGSFVVQEVAQSRLTGVLGLSTCVYGLVFYIAIFIASLRATRKIRHDGPEGLRS